MSWAVILLEGFVAFFRIFSIGSILDVPPPIVASAAFNLAFSSGVALPMPAPPPELRAALILSENPPEVAPPVAPMLAAAEPAVPPIAASMALAVAFISAMWGSL